MIVGINTHVAFEGREYHVQIEDLDATRELEARVYLEGRVLFQKRHSYAAAVEGLGNPKHIEAAVLEELQKFFGLIRAAILKGRIGV